LIRGDLRFSAVLDESTRRARRAVHSGSPVPRMFGTAAASTAIA